MKIRKKKLLCVLLCILMTSISLPACSMVSGQTNKSNDIEGSNLGGWGRALSAIPMKRNEMDPYYFGGMKKSNNSTTVIKEILSDSWDINSRDDLLYQINYLLYKGDRDGYLADVEYISGLSPENLNTFTEVIDEDLKMYLSETQRNIEKWGDRGILAWDMCRISLLAQWGYEAGLISKEEAHALIEPAADLIKEKFASWEEVMQSYLDGYAWWAEIDILAEGNEYSVRLAVYEELKANQGAENILFDNDLFTAEILPVEGVSYENLLETYE